jgi:hypothetical protein
LKVTTLKMGRKRRDWICYVYSKEFVL